MMVSEDDCTCHTARAGTLSASAPLVWSSSESAQLSPCCSMFSAYRRPACAFLRALAIERRWLREPDL